MAVRHPNHWRASFRTILMAAMAALLALLMVPSCVRAFDPAAGDFARQDPGDVRILSYNVQRNLITNGAVDAEFERLLRAIDPDVIVFQEIDAGLAASIIAGRLESYFPGETWTIHLGEALSGIRNVLASRYPVSMRVADTVPASDARGVTAALVDLPAGVFGAADLYVMGVHFKSFGTTTDHMRRQAHADAIVNWMRDARTAGGFVDLPANTPMVVAGDTNLGYLDQGDERPYHATRTLRDGDVFDEATYGPDSAPDWDGSETGDAAPYDHTNADSHTQPSWGEEPDSRLDRMIYTDSVMRAAGGFILNTATMTAGALSAAGLESGDTEAAADHLPVAVDFAPGADPSPPAALLINEFSYDDAGADDRTFVELINVGGRELNLQAPVDYQFLSSNGPLPAAPPGAENEAARFDLQGVIPPGGLFVLYDAAGESSAIAAVVEANLSRLQRQDVDTFLLPDGSDSGIALVTVEATDVFVTDDALVEAYMYEDSTAGGSHYFLTESGNSLLIELSGDRLSPLALTSDTLTFSRNRGDITGNSFADWTNPDTATPGAENHSSLRTVRWEIY